MPNEFQKGDDKGWDIGREGEYPLTTPFPVLSATLDTLILELIYSYNNPQAELDYKWACLDPLPGLAERANRRVSEQGRLTLHVLEC